MKTLKCNKIHILMLAILLIGGSFAGLKAAEEYAPKVKLPSSMSDRALWEPVVAKWKVPSKSEVPVPAYPGAVIVNLKETAWMTANGKKYTTLPVIVLATKADTKTVLGFYKEKLKNWNYKNDFGMFDVFWTGSGKFNSMDITQSATSPNVMISKANLPYTEYMPEAKTTITIVYKSVK